MEAARADAEKIRLLGGAEASAIEAVGKAEAERMRLKASAYKQYGEAAMLSLVLESLPKVGCRLFLSSCYILGGNGIVVSFIRLSSSLSLGNSCGPFSCTLSVSNIVVMMPFVCCHSASVLTK